MTTTLSEGVKVPDVGSVNWAGDLEVNWNLLNGALANLSGNVKLDRDNIWTGEQSFTLPIVGSIAGTASKAIADEDGTSIKTGYVNVAGNQTVTGQKTWTGSNTFNNILPNATNTYSLGSSTNQWSSVYAQTYYYNGTAWGLDKANVWTQSQTISINLPTFTLQDTIGVRNTTPANTRNLTFSFLDKNGDPYGFINRQHRAGAGTHLHQVSISNGTYDYRVQFYLYTDGKSGYIPSNDGVINLGTTNNKWKTINGVNPGALSLPDVSNWVSIDTTNWDKTGADNSYTPPIDGWILLRLNNVAGNYLFIANSVYSLYSNATGTNSSWFDCFMPVRANIALTIKVKGTSLVVARLIPCQGNV